MLFFMVTEGPPPCHRVERAPIDEALFQRIGQGDRYALEQLFLCTQQAVYAYTLSLLKNPDDALDIVQETYLKVRAAAHLYQPQGKPLAWLFTISRNLSLNLLRSQSSGGDLPDMENSLRFSYVTDQTDKLILESALTILGEQERQILLLHAVSGMKHREIAETLTLPLSTVLSRYNRSLKKLKKHLLEQGVSQ